MGGTGEPAGHLDEARRGWERGEPAVGESGCEDRVKLCRGVAPSGAGARRSGRRPWSLWACEREGELAAGRSTRTRGWGIGEAVASEQPDDVAELGGHLEPSHRPLAVGTDREVVEPDMLQEPRPGPTDEPHIFARLEQIELAMRRRTQKLWVRTDIKRHVAVLCQRLDLRIPSRLLKRENVVIRDDPTLAIN